MSYDSLSDSKDVTRWDLFKRKFEAVVCSHNLKKVFSEKYTSKTGEQIELFEAINAYIYAFLLSI